MKFSACINIFLLRAAVSNGKLNILKSMNLYGIFLKIFCPIDNQQQPLR